VDGIEFAVALGEFGEGIEERGLASVEKQIGVAVDVCEPELVLP
jgi:hypothetical protein